MVLSAGYGTVSDFEIVWTLVAAIGFVFSVLNLIGVIGDYKETKRMIADGLIPRNGRWYLARLAIFTESGRSYLQLMFVYLGILSMRVADPPVDPVTRERILIAIARWWFLTAAIWVMGKTIYTWKTRKMLSEDAAENFEAHYMKPRPEER